MGFLRCPDLIGQDTVKRQESNRLGPAAFFRVLRSLSATLYQMAQMLNRTNTRPWAAASKMRLRPSDESKESLQQRCSPLGINGRDVAPTPTGLAEIVSDYFPEYVATLE
jgi:hypothetical protein